MDREKSKAEIEREKKIKSATYEKRLKNKNNKFIIVSITLILLGYVFFFLSPKLFHELPERFYTELGTSVNFTGGSITPSSWVYAHSGGMMQVEFIFKSNQTLAPEIEVNAATSYDDRTKPSARLNAEVIYKENDFYIANIYNIPADYYCVSLRIKTIEDKKSENNNSIGYNDGLGNEVVRRLSETESASEEDKEVTSTAVIYTCRDAIEAVYSLYPLDDYIYRIKRIQGNINIDYSSISENNITISTLRDANSELVLRNDELTKEMLYMTSSEKQANEREIESNNSKIKDNNAKINTLESSNQSLQTEIQEYSEIIKRIAAENEGRDYTAPTQNFTEHPTELFSHAEKQTVTISSTEAPTQSSTVKNE